eukprot:Blabericola_migrator_1__7987@NODE_409_length_8743_cov_452_402259_g322_i0_p2_GENE_NODE_409_length_8743_cov_452_402259_g322_i0NODE_409_length_8743_cov_452_402259_g322_i0_p2_ORF_typecomplete_len668_score81_62_NODE_409_length_8743_cov_452_402259_g322_i035315534
MLHAQQSTMDSSHNNPPKIQYDLRVASYYPRKCDVAIPFTGVPTEELARRSAHQEATQPNAIKKHNASISVKNCLVDQGVVLDGKDHQEIRHLTRRRAPQAAAQGWFVTDDRDPMTTQMEQIHKSGRRQPLQRPDMVSGVLQLDPTEEDCNRQHGRSHKGHVDMNHGFSDVHALLPVVHKNQETIDMKPRGLARPRSKIPTQGSIYNIFTYPLPRKRLPGYNGCIEVEGTRYVKEYQRSNIEAFEGFIAPKTAECERQTRPKSRTRDPAPAAINHLTGGAVPLPGHQDSFEGKKRGMKEPSILKHFRNLEVQNQTLAPSDDRFRDGLVQRPSRRQVVAPRNGSAPNDLFQRARFKQAADRSAQVDHIWDLNRNWATDTLRNGKPTPAFEDPYPWQPIDEERELEYDIPNYPMVGHDPPHVPQRPCTDEAAASQPSRAAEDEVKPEIEYTQPIGVDEYRDLDDLYKCQPPPPEPDNVRPPPMEKIPCSEVEGPGNVCQPVPRVACTDQGAMRAHEYPIGDEYQQAQEEYDGCAPPNRLPQLSSQGDNCPVAGESAVHGDHPRFQSHRVPPHQYVDELKSSVRFHRKSSPRFGGSSDSSSDLSDDDPRKKEPEKLRLVSHMAVPASTRASDYIKADQKMSAHEPVTVAHFLTSAPDFGDDILVGDTDQQ